MERRDLMPLPPKMSNTERLMRDSLMSATQLSATEQIKRDMSLGASIAERHLQLARSMDKPISAVESAANKMMAEFKTLREPRNSLIDMVERQHRDMVQSVSAAAKAAAAFAVPSARQIMTDALKAANDIEQQRQQLQERTFNFARLDEISRPPAAKINRSPKPVPVSHRFVKDFESRFENAKSEAEAAEKIVCVRCETPSGEKIDVVQVGVAGDFFVKVIGINSDGQRREFEASADGLKLSIELINRADIDRANDEGTEPEEFVN